MPSTDVKYTVVQHSAFGYKDDPQFEAGLETRRVTTQKAQRDVIKVGGLLFDGQHEAETFCDEAMYPVGVEGLIPAARGTFAALKVDSLAVYISVREVVG